MSRPAAAKSSPNPSPLTPSLTLALTPSLTLALTPSLTLTLAQARSEEQARRRELLPGTSSSSGAGYSASLGYSPLEDDEEAMGRTLEEGQRTLEKDGPSWLTLALTLTLTLTTNHHH